MKTKIHTLIALLLLSWLLPTSLSANTKRALIIGIDQYQPTEETPEIYTASRGGSRGGEWQNLDGCVNDATSIKEIITTRYGFDDKNIVFLKNSEADRKRILKEIQQLIDESEKGDVVFIYYAGHGSQVKNSLAADGTGQDQTIVPVDLYDIRNKEFNKLFNQLLDKGVTLTLIFDSCHSGAIARGNALPTKYKTRDLPPVDFDFKDPADNPKPEDRGAVILSAAQRHQLAGEDVDDQGNPHGAFTAALIKALNNGSNESLEDIFASTKAIMKTRKPYQEPVMGANDTRKSEGLFGEKTAENGGKPVITILSNDAEDDIEIGAGYASGINPGSILKKITGKKDSIAIQVTEFLSVGKSKAKIVSGKLDNINVGDKFECVQFAVPDKPNLRVWYPTTTFTTAELTEFAKKMEVLKQQPGITWLDNPSIKAPTHLMQYYNGSWLLTAPGKALTDLGKNPTAEQVAKLLPSGALFFLQLPPTKDLPAKLKIGKGTDNNAIAITTNPSEADYVLTGRVVDGQLSYALVRPNIAESDSNYQCSLPLQTNWIDVASAGDSLTVYAVRLGKVNSWLTLSAPVDDGGFPFSLVLKNVRTGKLVSTSSKVYGGEKYSLALVTDSAKRYNWDRTSRFVYIFAIDKNGKTYQLYPPKNVGNDLNYQPGNDYNNEDEVDLKGLTFTIGKPFGFDTYFMVTTDEALTNMSAFNSEGVASFATRGPKDSALTHLLNNVGAKTRAPVADTPTNWSIQKMVIRSLPTAN